MGTLGTGARGVSEGEISLKKWTHRLGRSPRSFSSERVTSFLVSGWDKGEQGTGGPRAGPRGLGCFIRCSPFCSSHLSDSLANLGAGRKNSAGPPFRDSHLNSSRQERAPRTLPSELPHSGPPMWLRRSWSGGLSTLGGPKDQEAWQYPWRLHHMEVNSPEIPQLS